MGFNTIKIFCNFQYEAKDNGEYTDIFFTFNLTAPPGY